jgi:hypothetical protein
MMLLSEHCRLARMGPALLLRHAADGLNWAQCCPLVSAADCLEWAQRHSSVSAADGLEWAQHHS